MENKISTRRQAMASTAVLLSASHWASAWAQTPTPKPSQRRPTPSTTEGPYYPVKEPLDADYDLLRNGTLVYTKGQSAWVEGVVTDLDGAPLKGGTMEIWQCDEAGHYDHPGDGSKNDKAFQGFGRVTLSATGQFKFRTIKPALYSGRTAHIHAKIKLGSRELLTTQLYVQGEAGNAKDYLWRNLHRDDRAAVTVPFTAVADGLQAMYSLVVKA